MVNFGTLAFVTGATLLYVGVSRKDPAQVAVAWVTAVSLAVSVEARSVSLRAQAAAEEALRLSMEAGK